MNKKDILARINTLLKMYKDDIFLGEEIKQLHYRLKSIESSIVVVGQFSVGKSALLNAFLGDEILSTRRLESTKVTTRLRYCEKNQEKLILHYKNGDIEEQPIERVRDLHAYTTFQGGSKTDELAFVDVYWPLSFLDKHLQLVDTPGANSLTESAFSVTEKEIQKASSIIYLFNGQKGLDQTDYHLLTDLINRRKKLFIVASHTDGLTELEITEVLNSVSNSLMNQVKNNEEIKIYPVSSLEALEAKQLHKSDLLKRSKMEILEQALRNYMETQEYQQVELETISYDLELLESTIKEIQEQEQQAISERECERQMRLERLHLLTKNEFNQVKSYGFELLDYREQELEHFLIDSKAKIDQDTKKHKEEIFRSFREFKQRILEESQYQTTSLETLKRAYMDHLMNMSSKYKGVITEFEQTIEQNYGKVTNMILNEDNRFIANLEANKTSAKVDWPLFKRKLLNVKVKNRNIDYDKSLFLDTEAEKRELEQTYHQKQHVLKKIADDKEKLTYEFKGVLQGLENERDHDLKSIGEKPEPEQITETKGIFFWKKEVVVGHDYSAQKEWKHKASTIFEKYEQSKEKEVEIYNQSSTLLSEDENKERDELDSLEIKKEEIEGRLFDEIILSIDNQKQKAQESYRLIEQELEQLWLEQKRETEKQFNEHTIYLRKQFKNFIDTMLQKELNEISL